MTWADQAKTVTMKSSGKRIFIIFLKIVSSLDHSVFSMQDIKLRLNAIA